METINVTEPVMPIPVKLTKKALNQFIQWSSTRYNSYLNYGNKKENVDTIFNSLVNGFYTDQRGKQEPDKKTFTIQCAQGVGESGSGRYWKLTGKRKIDNYIIDCENKTITGVYHKDVIKFI